MSERIDRIRERWQRTRSVMQAPRIRILIRGGEDAHALHRLYTRRHPRFLMAQNKRWGVAMLPLPPTFDEYLSGRSMATVRQKRRKASDAGFRYAVVPPSEHLDEIMAINLSTPTRQGRPMSEAYVDREEMLSTFRDQPSMHAVLDGEGHVRAYALGVDLGEAYVLWKILGHAEDLAHGTMYLLVSEVIHGRIDAKDANGDPHWLMYDTFWGASAGLAFFKEKCGFKPYTVDWIWAGDR